jgi:hypothetical protein
MNGVIPPRKQRTGTLMSQTDRIILCRYAEQLIISATGDSATSLCNGFDSSTSQHIAYEVVLR